MISALKIGVAFLCAASLSSCGFTDAEQAAHAATRSATLKEMYPPGKTTRADIRLKFNHEPNESGRRPAGGWEKREDWWVRTYTTQAEKRVGKPIAAFDRYLSADGLFSLCHCWFYFDHRDRLVDAEWQWSSD